VGLLIPSTYIAASPQEYVDISYFHHPLNYIVSSLALAAGTFMVWLRVFYWLANDKGKVIFDHLVWLLCGIMTVNYMFFGTNLGNLSSILQYDNGVSFSLTEMLINIAVLLAITVILYLCVCYFKRAVATVLTISIIALGGMSGLNVATITKSVNNINIDSQVANFQLSTKGKNVIVIMLDRAIGAYVPYIFNEKPELKKQFSGFTYYSNVISFGSTTNFAVPALLGGYEYTPVEMNKRKEEKLVTKHNEALKVMPTLFAKNGYDVTVCDPVYANYQWIPDLSIFDNDKDIDAYITKGMFDDMSSRVSAVENKFRNFFCFSIMKSMPLFTQPTIYNRGKYNQISAKSDVGTTTVVQTAEGYSKATGIRSDFMQSYNVLENMNRLTNITNEEKNTFLFLANDLTHDPMLLKEPEYEPAEVVDNTEYDATHTERFILEDKKLVVKNLQHMIHYQTNVAALIKLGKWFDSLKESGVYDNTKIVLVSDHGRSLAQVEELVVETESGNDIHGISYYPLLMVKDFNSKEYTVSDEFMTNADVPTLATDGVINNPTNPFTGKAINSDEKTAHDQYIITSDLWDVNENNGNTFLPSTWISVKDNIWNKENWEFYDKTLVLDKHQAP
jgi:hypothetical protein